MDDLETREKILAAATAVFAEKGFAKASINDIVRISGLSKGGLYWHFASKDEILAAVFDRFFSTQLASFDALLARPGTASEQLLHLGALIGEDVGAWAQQFPSPLEFYALAARDDVLIHALQTYFRAYQERLMRLVARGIQDGEFRPVSVIEVTHTLSALFEGLLLVWAVFPVTVDLTRQLESSLRLLLDGLRRPQ